MITQIAVFMENRKGRLQSLTKTLSDNGIDLLSLSVADTRDFGILRLIARDNEKAVRVLKEANFTVNSTKMIGIEVADKPGGLHGILEILNDNDINIEYIYSHAHKSRTGAMIFIKVTDAEEQRALQLLKSKGIKILEQKDL